MIIYLGFWGFETRTYVSETGSLLYDYGTLENTQTEHNEYWSGGMVPGKKYRIEVEFIDKSGNKSATSSVEAWTKANAPSITVANNKENVWTGEKTIQITGIENHKIKYTTNGSEPSKTNGIELTGTGAKTFKVNVNNTVIKAVYINTVTGEVNSAVGSKTITKIDKNPPITAELVLVSNSANQIKVNARGADVESGVKYYRFEKSTTSTTSGFTTDSNYQVNTGTREHTYNVNANTTYYLRVVVVDQAGNEKISNVLIVKTLLPAPIITVENPDTWSKTKTVTVSAVDPGDNFSDLWVIFKGTCGCHYSIICYSNQTYYGESHCSKHSSSPLGISYSCPNPYNGTWTVPLHCTVTAFVQDRANGRYSGGNTISATAEPKDVLADSEPPYINYTLYATTIKPGLAMNGVTFSVDDDGSGLLTDSVKVSWHWCRWSTSSSWKYTYIPVSSLENGQFLAEEGQASFDLLYGMYYEIEASDTVGNIMKLSTERLMGCTTCKGTGFISGKHITEVGTPTRTDTQGAATTCCKCKKTMSGPTPVYKSKTSCQTEGCNAEHTNYFCESCKNYVKDNYWYLEWGTCPTRGGVCQTCSGDGYVRSST